MTDEGGIVGNRPVEESGKRTDQVGNRESRP